MYAASQTDFDCGVIRTYLIILSAIDNGVIVLRVKRITFPLEQWFPIFL